MVVTKANIDMAAQHKYIEQHQVTERLEFWLGQRGAALGPNSDQVYCPPSTRLNQRGPSRLQFSSRIGSGSPGA